MRSYDLIRMLKQLDYKFVKQYESHEVWEKDDKYFTFPNQEQISSFYLKSLLKENGL